MNTALLYKVFASLILFLDSYPPVPLSTWKGGTHISGFSTYEGAARRASRANEMKQENSNRSFPASFVPAAFGCRGLRPVREQK